MKFEQIEKELDESAPQFGVRRLDTE